MKSIDGVLMTAHEHEGMTHDAPYEVLACMYGSAVYDVLKCANLDAAKQAMETFKACYDWVSIRQYYDNRGRRKSRVLHSLAWERGNG